MLTHVAIWFAAWTLVSMALAPIVGHAIGFLQGAVPTPPRFVGATVKPRPTPAVSHP